MPDTDNPDTDNPERKRDSGSLPVNRDCAEAWASRPVPPYEPMDWSGFEVTDVYEYVEDPPEGCPRFKVRHAPRPDWQTPEQYQISRRHNEEQAWIFSVHLGLAQEAATVCGYHRDCGEKACRRARKCVSRRAEDDWRFFPGPMMPPCCVGDRTEPVRQLLRELSEHWKATSPGDEPDGPPLRARPQAQAPAGRKRGRR